LAQETAAAPDIEGAQACKAIEPLGVAREPAAYRCLDETKPHRIELVQHAHFAMEVPPRFGERGKTCDFARIDGRTSGIFGAHPRVPQAQYCGLSIPRVMYTRLFAPWLGQRALVKKRHPGKLAYRLVLRCPPGDA